MSERCTPRHGSRVSRLILRPLSNLPNRVYDNRALHQLNVDTKSEIRARA
jgi:hypothetical protein